VARTVIRAEQALGPVLMHVPPRVFLLGMIDKVVSIALERPIAAGGIGIQLIARLHGDVGSLLHRLHGEIAGRVEDDSPLAADPGDNRGPVFVIWPRPGSRFFRRPRARRPKDFFPPCCACPLLPAV